MNLATYASQIDNILANEWRLYKAKLALVEEDRLSFGFAKVDEDVPVTEERGKTHYNMSQLESR